MADAVVPISEHSYLQIPTIPHPRDRPPHESPARHEAMEGTSLAILVRNAPLFRPRTGCLIICLVLCLVDAADLLVRGAGRCWGGVGGVGAIPMIGLVCVHTFCKSEHDVLEAVRLQGGPKAFRCEGFI